MKYYCYRHIRLDKNEPFYIGIGTKREGFCKSVESEYERAYNRQQRSNLWHKIVNKTEYSIEILFESDSRQEIIDKEIEFIRFYGRKDNSSGCLANLTDGGEGSLGAKRSSMTNKKHSKSILGKRNPFYGKKHSDETKKKISLKNSNRITSKETRDKLSKLRKGKTFSKEEKIETYKNNKRCKAVISIKTGEEYYSLRHGCEVEGIKYTSEKYRIYNNSPLINFKFKQ